MVSHELLRFRRACSRFFHRFIRISSLLLRLLSLPTSSLQASGTYLSAALFTRFHVLDFSRIVLQDLVNWSTITRAILDFSRIIFDEYIVVRRKFENFESRVLGNSLKVGGYDGWLGLWKSRWSFFL